MLDWKEIVQNYIIKYSNTIRAVTRPLRDHFNINYFTYHKIDSTGKYTVLVDRPDWAEYYTDNKLFLNDPYLRHPSVYQSGLCLLEQHGSEEYKTAIIESGKNILEMDLGAMLIQKNEDSVEFFGFTANKLSSPLQNLYVNHPNLLKSFAAHFKQELRSILNTMKQEPISLATLKGPDFFVRSLSIQMLSSLDGLPITKM